MRPAYIYHGATHGVHICKRTHPWVTHTYRHSHTQTPNQSHTHTRLGYRPRHIKSGLCLYSYNLNLKKYLTVICLGVPRLHVRILCTRGLTCSFCFRDTKAPKCLSSYKNAKRVYFFCFSTEWLRLRAIRVQNIINMWVCVRAGVCVCICVRVCIDTRVLVCVCVRACWFRLLMYFFYVHANKCAYSWETEDMEAISV